MGVTVTIIKPGDGTTFPQRGDRVTVHYTGTLEDGSKFDSSIDRAQPFTVQIGIGQVIKGWDVGIPKMSLGECSLLDISADYAYGPGGMPGIIPPNSALKFRVELLKISREQRQSGMG